MPRYLLVCLSTLLSGACAATLTAEQHRSSSMMRRSVENMELGGSGDLIRLKPKAKQDSSPEKQGSTPETCNKDFTAGPDGQDACTNHANHTGTLEHLKALHIDDSAVCSIAADDMGLRMLRSDSPTYTCSRQAGAPKPCPTTKTSFFTSTGDFDKYPSGCYTDLCGDVPACVTAATDTEEAKPVGCGPPTSEKCVFFNEVPLSAAEYQPDCETAATDTEQATPAGCATRTGNKICARPTLAEGLINTAGDEASCPPFYKPIDFPDYCKEAGKCKGIPNDGLASFELDDKNRSLHDYYPQGCYSHDIPNVQNAVKNVNFGPKRKRKGAAATPEDWLPGAPRGTPICVVKTPAKRANVMTDEEREVWCTAADGSALLAASDCEARLRPAQATPGTCADVVCESPKVKDTAKAAEACEGTPADCTTAESKTKCCKAE